jgi:hypothetical protein
MNDTIDIQPKHTLKEFQGLSSSITTKGEVREMLKKGIWLYLILLIFEGALRIFSYSITGYQGPYSNMVALYSMAV